MERTERRIPARRTAVVHDGRLELSVCAVRVAGAQLGRGRGHDAHAECANQQRPQQCETQHTTHGLDRAHHKKSRRSKISAASVNTTAEYAAAYSRLLAT